MNASNTITDVRYIKLIRGGPIPVSVSVPIPAIIGGQEAIPYQNTEVNT